MNRILTALLVLLLTLPAAGCDLVGDIIEFGFWVVAIIVALIVLLVWWIARKVRGPREPRGPTQP